VAGTPDVLIANLIVQGEALAFGKSSLQAHADGIPEALTPHRVFAGNRPSNTFIADRLTPYALDARVAFYEHSVLVQGVIWDINSFNQWGVELGKKLARTTIAELAAADEPELDHDRSSNALIRRYRQLRGQQTAATGARVRRVHGHRRCPTDGAMNRGRQRA